MTKNVCRDWDCELERKEGEIAAADVNAGKDIIMAGIFIIAMVLAAFIANIL
jgi:hypothetical protein